MVREESRNCRSFLFFFLTTMSIFSIRKKDDGVFTVLTSPTSHFWAADRAPYSGSLLLLRSGSSRGVSSIFRNVCRVGVFSQGCLRSHINAGAFADTESDSEKRRGRVGRHSTLQSWSVSVSLRAGSRAAAQTPTASCKIKE